MGALERVDQRAVGRTDAPRDPAEITIRRPDDWHVHLRDDDMLRLVAPHTAAQFARAIVMPNLVPPVTTVAAAEAYRGRILASLPPGSDFRPLMTCYLTEGTSVAEIERGLGRGLGRGQALPRGGHDQFPPWRAEPGQAAACARGHAAHRHAAADPRRGHRPRGGHLRPRSGLRRADADRHPARLPGAEGGARARHHGGGGRLRAGARAAARGDDHAAPPAHQPHVHLPGRHPAASLLPAHRQARAPPAGPAEAATSGDACFFLGTDTAPHPDAAKESACGCAGIFVAPSALQTYAQVFDEEGRLENLEAFASLNGPRFYGLPPNEGTVTLRRRAARLRCGPVLALPAGEVTVFRAEEELPWSLDDTAPLTHALGI